MGNYGVFYSFRIRELIDLNGVFYSFRIRELIDLNP